MVGRGRLTIFELPRGGAVGYWRGLLFEVYGVVAFLAGGVEAGDEHDIF